MSVAAEPMPGNSVIPPTTNVTESFGADRGESSDPIINIRGALDSIGRTEGVKPKTEPKEAVKAAVQEPQAPKEIPFVDKSGKEKPAEAEKPIEGVAETPAGDAPIEETAPEDKEGKRWGELKKIEKQHKEAQKEIETLRAKIAEAEKGSVEMERLKQELQEAKEERESIDQEFYLTRVEATREYKQFVTEKLAQVDKQAATLAERNKIDPITLQNALREDVKGNATALEELVADLTEREKTRIYGLSDQLTVIAEREADIKANSKSAYEAAIRKEQERNEQETQKTIQSREAVVAKIVPKLASEIIDKMPEDARPDMDRLSKEVLNVNSWPEELKVYGGIAAAVLPYMIENNKSLQSQIAELKAANSKLRGGSPSPAAGRTPSAPAEAEKPTNYATKKGDDFIKEMVSRLPTFNR